MKEVVVRIAKRTADHAKRVVFGWQGPVALGLSVALAACSPAIEQQSSIQSVNVIYPNSAKENLGLTSLELNQLKDIKGDFINEASSGNILGFSLDKSSNNEKLTPQEIIARNLSKAASDATGTEIVYTADQVDAPNEEVMPMMVSIGERNLPMISQTYDVQIEGEEKPTKLLFFYTKEDGVWRQTGFITKQPTIVNGEIRFEFNPMLDVTESNNITTFGMIIASDSIPKNNNIITFTNIDGKPAMVETFPNGTQLIGFLPGDGDFFFPTEELAATSSDLPIKFGINPAVTQSPPIEELPTTISTVTPLPPATPILEPTPTQVINMTEEKWNEIIAGGVFVVHDKQYITEEVLNRKDFTFLGKENLVEIMSLPSGTEIMVLNPSGEIIVWVNPDEATKRAAEGATIVIPNPDVKQGGLANAVKVILNSAFRAWEKDKTTPIHVQFGECDTDRISAISLLINEIPHITDDSGRIISPILEMPKYFVVVGTDSNFRSEKAGVTDPIYWLDELISKGFRGISVEANQEVFDWHYPPGQ